jgi:hypothetical protein
MKENWSLRLVADTRTVSGKRRRINRSLLRGRNYDLPVKELVKFTVNNLPSSWEFYGVDLHLVTPLHHTIYVIDPDTREIRCVS